MIQKGKISSVEDFYPRPPRGGRPVVDGDRPRDVSISIHALREEGDGVGRGVAGLGVISIHALREEGDSMSSFGLPLIALFLSTPSARRATSFADGAHLLHGISIHALREEGDLPSTTPC